jgi:hypothetical protein
MGKSYMPRELALLLRRTIDRELPGLRALTDEEALGTPPKPGAWSRKEELGHLIDSAANNHKRFVVASLNGEFRGAGYAQNSWVDAHGYRDIAWAEIVDLWYRFNSLLAHLVERIPDERMSNTCVIGADVFTLGFVIEDYVLHMQHHLNHVLSSPFVGPLPRC